MVIMKSSHRGWEPVAVFGNFADGKMLESALRDRGFEVRTYDDKFFRRVLFLRPPGITYRVQVRSNDLPAATRLLEAEHPAVLGRALHCPACGSRRVNYPQMTRKFVLPTVLLHLGIIFRVIEHQCYCEHCHEMWVLPKRGAVGESAKAGIN
jgi:hypothetical protein